MAVFGRYEPFLHVETVKFIEDRRQAIQLYRDA